MIFHLERRYKKLTYKGKWRFQFPEYASYELKPENSENKEIGKIYELLKGNKASFFYQCDYTQIFIAAMALGYINKNKTTLKKKSRSIPTKVFTFPEKWLMISVAIEEENDLAILKEAQKILNIAEEYANGGIYFLYGLFEEGHAIHPVETFEKYFRQELNRRLLE